jgi:NADPH:quinone reductase-like Zn-dependent oxidoreductase
MPTQACGVVFTAPGQVDLERFTLPDPGPQQVLMRTTRTLVSAGTEVKALLNLREGEAQTRYPVRPGYSSVGIVVAAGEAVTEVQPGDRVLTMGRHATHTTVDLDPNRFVATAGQRAPQYLQQVPDGVSDEQAVFAVLGSASCMGCAR